MHPKHRLHLIMLKVIKSPRINSYLEITYCSSSCLILTSSSSDISGCHGQCKNGATCKVRICSFLHLQCCTCMHQSSSCPSALHISWCFLCRRAWRATTASAPRVLWAHTVKSRGISVRADHARTAASATQCWTASCVSAHQSLLDSCVRWVSCSAGQSAGLSWMQWQFRGWWPRFCSLWS